MATRQYSYILQLAISIFTVLRSWFLWLAKLLVKPFSMLVAKIKAIASRIIGRLKPVYEESADTAGQNINPVKTE